MLQRIPLLLAACALQLPVFSAANPFAGTWKFNQAKSDLKGQTYTIASLGDNRFRFTFGSAQDFTINADGTDQTSLPGTTVAITVKDPNTWELVFKTNGTKTGTATCSLAADGKSQACKFTVIRPDGSEVENTFVDHRVSGSGGFAGVWQRASMTLGNPSLLQIDASPNGNLAVSWPSDKVSMTVTLDGNDFAVEGPTVVKGATASATRKGAHSIRMTDKLNGKVLDTADWKVSSDGKVLTITEHDAGVKKATVSVYDRQ